MIKVTLLAVLFCAFSAHANLPTGDDANIAAQEHEDQAIVASVIDDYQQPENVAFDESGWNGIVEQVKPSQAVASNDDSVFSIFGSPAYPQANSVRRGRRTRYGSQPAYENYGGGGGSSCGSGQASWYPATGHRTASGAVYTGGSMTAAHKTLPFGTHVRVTNHNTGRSIVVVINDRGPFVRGRIIDLSPAARSALGMGGTAAVSLTCI